MPAYAKAEQYHSESKDDEADNRCDFNERNQNSISPKYFTLTRLIRDNMAVAHKAVNQIGIDGNQNWIYVP